MPTTINNIKTFSALLSKVGIEIPLIQRDYVQGRIHDTNELEQRNDEQAKALLKKYTDEREKRDSFVKKLVEALYRPQDPAMQLTFIYGTMEQTTGVATHHPESFIPLDGQQRLTTLFLLSWVLLYRLDEASRQTVEALPSFIDFVKGLNSVRYSTRPSSGSFCNSLFSESLAAAEDKCLLSETITKQSWFGDDWRLDPSVQSMLQMIDQIDTEVSEYDNAGICQMAVNLIEGKGIEFELLDMKDYQLTDGLYIKMNARGKQLTKFENWKSEFIWFLDNVHHNELYDFASKENVQEVFNGRTPTLKEYFEYSIEHQWTDLFWPYCQEEIRQHEDRLKAVDKVSKSDKDCYPIIDDYFMNCFHALHQLFFFIDNQTDEPKLFQDTVAQREATFGNVDHIKELFRYLDILKEFDDKNIYQELFFVEESNQYEHKSDLVRLFDGKEELNLLTRCAKAQDFTNVIQIILYGMLRYASNFGVSVTSDFKSFVRQVRNLAEGESFLRKSDAAMTNTLKICQIHKIKRDIDNLIEQAGSGTLLYISNEHAEIDDMDFGYGNLKANFLPTSSNSSVGAFSLALVRDVLKAWDSLEEYEKIALLVGYGYQGVYILTCAMGDTYLLGNDDRWKTIMMRDPEVETAFKDMINDYQAVSITGVTGAFALRQLLSKKKDLSKACFDFRYYVLNYEKFVYSHAKWKDATMYFAIRGDRDELNICSIIYSGKPVLAYYTNPVVYATKEELYSRNQGKELLYINYSTRGGESARIDIYKEKQWNDNGPICSFIHKCGTHGNGGWQYKDHMTGQITDCNDVPKIDRIIAGADFIKSIFPDNDFAEKG